MNANWLAIFVLFSWPAVALLLFRLRPLNQAIMWTILGAQMLLPASLSFKFQMIPAFDKASLPNFAALIGCIFVAQRRVRFWTRFGFVEIMIIIFVLSPVVTSALNNDPIVIGNTVLPDVGYYDGFSAALVQFLTLLPFFLGRQFLRTTADNAEVLRTLVIAGLIYSLPMLFEIRMSPQLNLWIYGYYATDFIQQMRFGGFRPVVFMGHSLAVAFFTMTTLVAAAALWRTRTRLRRLSPGGITIYLSVLLILCKSGAALIYAAVLVPLVRLTNPRLQLRLALLIVTVALLYPLLRSADLIPTGAITQLAGSISTDRAESIKFRFNNEDALLERAHQRFLFGWARFGRNRVYDEYGKDISVTDGAWIIAIGQFGLVGFLALFGLLALPVVRAPSALKSTESLRDSVFFSSLTLILAISIFDLLPNAGLTPWTWLLAGSLLGRIEALVGAPRPNKPHYRQTTDYARQAFETASNVERTRGNPRKHK